MCGFAFLHCRAPVDGHSSCAKAYMMYFLVSARIVIAYLIGVPMHWYLIHTKPRQEKIALENLERQGYQCYLPTMASQKLRLGQISLVSEPLFPRYLFIRLGMEQSSQSWSPIRYTTGVSRLVSFGAEPAKVDEALIEGIQAQESRTQQSPAPLFNPGDRVQITDGAFAGIEGVFQMADGNQRVFVLIEMMSKLVSVGLGPALVRKMA